MLRQMNNEDLFQLYDSDLVLRLHNAKNLSDTRKNVRDLKTIGMKLNKEQALHLARVLLAVTQEWDEIDITAYRFEKRKSDGTYHITVTNFQPEES